MTIQIPEIRKAQKARVIMVGSVTGNDNTVGGGGVWPIANLRELEGLAAGGNGAVSPGSPLAGPDGLRGDGLCRWPVHQSALWNGKGWRGSGRQQ